VPNLYQVSNISNFTNESIWSEREGWGVGHLTSGSEAGSYLRLIDSCITQLKAQRPSRTCNERNEEEEVTEMCSGSEAGSYLRLIDVCITEL